MLNQFIHVQQSGVRSINIEQDVEQTIITKGYVITAQVQSTLARMLDRLNALLSPAHAWTLTGPYGSGKSFFGLFMMNLFCRELPAHHQTIEQLKKENPLLAEQVAGYAQFNTTKGFLPIPITGYRATLQECLLHGLERMVLSLTSHKSLSIWYENIKNSFLQANSRQVIAHLHDLNEVVTEIGYRGVFFILDEMGKPLEQLANHAKSGDIYLLQEIAEFADHSNSSILFVGILHQSFERYAGHLDLTTQREWAKVQGRFADIAFQEPPHQQMALLAKAIVRSEPLPEADNVMADYGNRALQSGWKPPLLSKRDFEELTLLAYPLHPTAFVALPHLFRRLAQNERSLFSYLGSLEPYGFQEFLQTHELPEVIQLYHLFDYVVANFQGRLYASMRGRLITETVERLQNGRNLSPLAIRLLKTIGMVNWLAEVSDLQPTRETLLAALYTEQVSATELEIGIEQLINQSLIVFRKFNRSYVIWQGSDVDLDECLLLAESKLQGTFRLAQTVEHYLPPRPVIARGHSYRTGFMRFWQIHYIDSADQEIAPQTTQPGFSGTIILGLPIIQSNYDDLMNWVSQIAWQDKPDFIIGIAKETERLVQLAQEFRALHWVQENTPELRDDPVARRELRSRLNALEIMIRNEIDQTLGPHRLAKGHSCRWFYRGTEITSQFGRGLSFLLSTISDELYPNSPILWNELINRRVLSTQGAAARRNLIEAMWQHEGEVQLGIAGYPPERSMYESVLVKSGLYRPDSTGKLAFQAPSKEDPLGLRPVWSAMTEWIFTPIPQQRPLTELFALLNRPPYGLTDGVLPVLLCAFMCFHRNETTLYREGSLLPSPSVADWEVLLRRPELFTIIGVHIQGPRIAIIKRLAQSLDVAPAALPIVRKLIHQLTSLPQFTWRTQQLTPQTKALRRAIEQARSPEQLLFNEIPEALDLPPFAANQETNQTQIQTFFNRLNLALQELAQALPQIIANARDSFLQACAFAKGPESWLTFRHQAAVLLPYVTHPNLLPLLKRAAETEDPDIALESVLAYISGRAPRTWSDNDVERFPNQSARLGDLFQTEYSGYDPMAGLSPAQRQTGSQVVNQLRQYLAQQLPADPAIQRAALRAMLNELEQATTPKKHPPTKP